MGPTSRSMARSMSVVSASSPRRRARRNGAAIPVALPGHDLRLEPGGDGRVVLRLPGQGAEHGAGVRPAQERGQLAQLILQVAAEVSVVSRGEELGRVDGEGVKKDVGLGGPPAVDGLLGHPGPGGDALDRQAGETALDQQVIGRFQDGQPGFLAAPVPVAVVAGLGASLHAAQRTGPLPRRNVASTISAHDQHSRRPSGHGHARPDVRRRRPRQRRLGPPARAGRTRPRRPWKRRTPPRTCTCPSPPRPASSSTRSSGPAGRKPSWSSARRSASPPSTSPPR